MPGRSRLSDVAEVETIMAAAGAVGIDCHVEHRNRRWSQIEKRNHLMTAAARMGDWIVVVDGDTYVSHCDPVKLRATLDQAGEDVALLEVTNVGFGVRATWPRKRRLIVRADAGVRVVTGHNGYQAADGRWLNGDTEHVQLAPATDVSAHLKLLHTIDSRGRVRRGQQQDYYAARVDTGEEAWATA